jgi:glycerol-3-phosphate acyltransferase PlsY
MWGATPRRVTSTSGNSGMENESRKMGREAGVWVLAASIEKKSLAYHAQYVLGVKLRFALTARIVL